MKKYDVVVIGAGPGGTPAAIQLSRAGKNVLLVDDRGKPGGECLYEGCIPSKTLEQSADYFYLLKYMKDFGINGGGTPSINWAKVVQKKDNILKQRSEMELKLFDSIPTLTFMNGKAQFISDNEIEIWNPAKNELIETVSFDYAIIATGSKPFIPPIEGSGISKVWTNKEMFDEKELPKSVVIIGAGAIGIEFAQMFAKVNVHTTVIEMLNRILPPVESDFASLLHEKMEKQDKVAIYLSSKVKRIDYNNDKFTTTFELSDNSSKSIISDRVIVASGRRANIEPLQLEKTDIDFNKRGIVVNEYLETNIKGIYAVGDIINGPTFAHTATYEALIAVNNILRGNNSKTDFVKNSWVLFSDPEIASAGLTEEQASKMGYEIITGIYDYKKDARAQINDRPFGLLKFIVEKQSGRLLGIHIFTEGAADLVGEAVLAVSCKATIKDIADAIHPHPTLTEAFGILARQMLGEMEKNKMGMEE
ncbi:Dihydrolipoamide dehydrogenase [hydrothermal vent metagenome]|uniref:Dihydrolipoamide dehydrogenase n=1 Tax=hydrothermal vent metagenome TaxID=652676 RepID=A0A3B1CDG1_9ZZZZ